MLKVHIPTEQYGFIEAEVETPLEAKVLTHEVKSTFNDQLQASKLTQVEWNQCLDTYIASGTLHSEEYAKMSQIQKNIIQEIKKSVKRVEYKVNK